MTKTPPQPRTLPTISYAHSIRLFILRLLVFFLLHGDQYWWSYIQICCQNKQQTRSITNTVIGASQYCSLAHTYLTTPPRLCEKMKSVSRVLEAVEGVAVKHRDIDISFVRGR